MRRTITEKYDEQGNLTERVTVEEDVTPVVINPAPNQPNDYVPWPIPLPNTPYIQPGTVWQGQGGCSACALSGICNCVIGPNQWTRSAAN